MSGDAPSRVVASSAVPTAADFGVDIDALAAGDDFDFAGYAEWCAREESAGRERIPEPWELEGPAISISLGDASDIDPALLAALCERGGQDGRGGQGGGRGSGSLGASFEQGKAADVLRPGPVLGVVTEQAVDDLDRLEDEQLMGALAAARRLQNRASYLQTVVIAEFARRRAVQREEARSRKVPKAWRPGEYPDAELAFELVASDNYAAARICEATDLTTRLPRTLAGMADGSIDAYRASIIYGYTFSLNTADAAHADEVLADAAPSLRYDQLSAKASALEMKLDPEAVARRKALARKQGQRVEARRENSGNASIAGREMDTATALAIKANIDALAAKLRNGNHEGTLQRLRYLAFAELLQGRNPLDRLAREHAPQHDPLVPRGPKTAASETAASETAAPETAAPETAASETAAPKTAAPKPAASKSDAPKPPAATSDAPNPADPVPADPVPPGSVPPGSDRAGPQAAGPHPAESRPVSPHSGGPQPTGPQPAGPQPVSPQPASPKPAAPDPGRWQDDPGYRDYESDAEFEHDRDFAVEPAFGDPDKGDPDKEETAGAFRFPFDPVTQAGGLAPMPALINLVVPVGTFLGWSTAPAQAGGWGLLDARETRNVVRSASQHPRTRWCLTIVGPDGTAIAHACASGQHPWRPPQAVPDPDPVPNPVPDPDPNPDADADPRPSRDATGARSAELCDLFRRMKVTFAPIVKDACDHAEAEDRYTPSRKLKHLVRARTTKCTAPGCNAEAVHCDLDHTRAYPDGPSCQCNLAPKCRRHHRVKQARGWQVDQPQPGVMRWSVPSGRAYTTTPARYDL